MPWPCSDVFHRHPVLRPLQFDLQDGLTPDEAAILAVYANPSLRAERDLLAEAQAQLVQAGLLPNPQISASIVSGLIVQFPLVLLGLPTFLFLMSDKEKTPVA